MATTFLNQSQVAEVLAPSKRYDKAAYETVLASARQSGKPFGHVETLFPGVKPAHVAFMLKQLRGDDKTLVVDTHADHGVCLIAVAAVKPAARKPAARKPAAKKPATGGKHTTRKAA